MEAANVPVARELQEERAEISVSRKLFDPEENKVTLEIEVRIGEVTKVVKKSGSIGRIAFQLVEQFALPVQAKDLAKQLQDEVKRIPLELEEEPQLYQEFLSWFTENYAPLAQANKCFVKLGANNPPVARLTESAMAHFFASRGLRPQKRHAVLAYWRDRGWLKVNESARDVFKKVVKFKAEDGTVRTLRVYEVELNYELFSQNAEEMQEMALAYAE